MDARAHDHTRACNVGAYAREGFPKKFAGNFLKKNPPSILRFGFLGAAAAVRVGESPPLVYVIKFFAIFVLN